MFTFFTVFTNLCLAASVTASYFVHKGKMPEFSGIWEFGEFGNFGFFKFGGDFENDRVFFDERGKYFKRKLLRRLSRFSQ